MDALLAVQERGQSSLPAYRLELRAATGQHLVRVALVADVPDQGVARGVEHVVQRNGQFHGAEAGGEMSAGAGHGLDQEAGQLAGEFAQAGFVEAAQVRR